MLLKKLMWKRRREMEAKQKEYVPPPFPIHEELLYIEHVNAKP